MLNAELRQFVPQLQSEVRVRAERMRQLNRDTYFAQNAWATASQFGKPGYRIQASEVFVEKRLSDPWVSVRRCAARSRHGGRHPQRNLLDHQPKQHVLRG